MVHTPSKAEMERPHLESIEPKKRKAKKHAKNDGTPELRHDFEERRLKKLQKQAKKVAEHFAALGLDENGDPLDNFSLLKYPVRECKFTIPGCHEPIAINPVVVLIGVFCLWGMVLWNVGKCGHLERVQHER
jgi:hypothetical protein